ncbi:unnamed protein product [Brassicogethes aeneus]|uniref:Uncharacterized protein n=1 Tax=Brassicogethes aeneus TaxID=1431903 RepID=A0A9P0B6G9_BRAAE|nr:unnamed protein product [Brassicogethes aeneus]
MSMQVDSTNGEKEIRIQTQDKYKLTYVLFYAFGLLTQVPNNFFVTANAYWMYKFRDTSHPFDPSNKNKTELQVQFTSNFSIVSQVITVLFLATTAIFGNNVAIHKKIIFSLSLMMLMFMITIVFVVIDTDSCKYEQF